MKRIVLLSLAIALAWAAAAAAQQYARQNETFDYTLEVYDPPTMQRFLSRERPEVTRRWWKAFIEKASLDGYCWDMLTLPLHDRPELGDKAAILKAGGMGQLVQVIEIPPGGKTRWHSYGYNGEPLMLGLSGRGQTEFYSALDELPSNKYAWKKHTMFATPKEHRMQHSNSDPSQPARLLVVTGYAINLYPYVAEELRSARQNPAETREDRAQISSVATYPGHYVEDLRDHPVTVRESRGLSNAYFNVQMTAGHQTHGNIHMSQLNRPEAYAHKHGNSPMFVILRGSGYDLWSAATDLAAYEADVKAGRTHKASYKEGGLCGVPAGPHWHQHFRVGDEPVRWLAIVPRGEYEEKPRTQ